MQHCPGCGANLKFDIALQKLLCPYCENVVEPEELDPPEAKAEEMFETTVYRCPQCYGELSGDDNEASVFCPYCGNSTILEGRLFKKKRPKYIIPFKVKKEDCMKSYKKMLFGAPYAPREMKKEGTAQSFRGIYIPYWYFTAVQKDPASVKAVIRRNKDDQTICEFFHIDMDMDATYEGITYDASELFDDQISQALTPFHLEDRKDFAPGYMSGFYADGVDVEASNYAENATTIAAEESFHRIAKDVQFYKFSIEDESTIDDVKASIPTKIEEETMSLMPVWFMSYKFGDRISYASINGQTGKAVGLIPASPKMYLLWSLLLTIPLFFGINMISFPRPELAMLIANALAFAVYLIFDKELTLVQFREKMGRVQQYERGMVKKAEVSPFHKCCKWGLIIGTIIGVPAYFISMQKSVYEPKYCLFTNVTLTILMLWLTVFGIIKTLKDFPFKLRLFFCGIPIGSILIVLMQLINPVNDLWFYGMCIFQIIASCLAFVDLIHYHNLLATRPMPQFHRTGGDDNA